MTNVFHYFGLQDVAELVARVDAGDPGDLHTRAEACTSGGAELATQAGNVEAAATALAGAWQGEAATAALQTLRTTVAQRREQGQQLQASASSLTTVATALEQAQAEGHRILGVSEGLSRALDSALDRVRDVLNATVPGAGVLNWAVDKVTGVDLESEAQDLLLSLTNPLREQALGLIDAMEQVIRGYEQVLGAQGEVLRALPGIVRADAGPVDQPGDRELREGAFFRSVYGHDPVTPADRRMAQALDVQGSDATNTDPNARVVVMRITPVPGAGVVHGDAFISADDELNPFSAGGHDEGDDRGFSPGASAEDGRVSFDVDYENGVVVVRQNASHSTGGDADIGDPSVGIEQDPQGRVRLRVDATNPLAPEIAADNHVSVRGDLLIDPHGGTGPAEVNGAVTRFPSWEVYQDRDGQTGAPLLQRPENELPLGAGPMVGLPQPTVPVGPHPGDLDDFRTQHHPDQGHDPFLDDLLQYPSTRGDSFYEYPLPNQPYPTVDSRGGLVVPRAPVVR
ncbi:hypothetical protein GCM10027047_06200 [Rhodococcus aerolatus]